MTRLLLPSLDVSDAPKATPPVHGLRDSARQIPVTGDRWEGGLTFCPETCMDVLLFTSMCDPDGTPSDLPGQGQVYEDPPTDQVDCVDALPYTLYVPFSCDALAEPSRDDRGRVTRALEAGTTKGMERQFWSDPLNTGNFALTKDTPATAGDIWAGTPGVVNPVLGTPVNADVALVLLTQALAACRLGSRGMIHAPAAITQQWVGKEGIERDGPRLVTSARGDVVVVGSGYDGTGPGGSARPAGAAWAYATGMVEYRLGDPFLESSQLAEVLNRRQNTVTWYAKRTAVEQVDGCCSFAVLVSYA